MPDPIRILSIDGGGLRGVIAVRILKKIEEYINSKQPISHIPHFQPNIKITDKLNLIAGTSTGALLACAMTVPKPDVRIPKPKFTLDEISKIYEDRGKEIFPNNWWEAPYRWGKSLIMPQFSTKGLEEVLKDSLGDHNLSDGIVNLFIPSFNLKTNSPLIFTSRKAWEDSNFTVSMYHACRASSAAPSFLKPYEFKYNQQDVLCIDGGVFMNNPSMNAIAEVLKHRDHYKIDESNIKDIFLLSISTGKHNKQEVGFSAKHFGGKLIWASPVTKIMMSGQSSATNYSAKQALNINGSTVNYYRIEIDLLNNNEAEMTNSNKKITDIWIDKVEKKFQNRVFISELDKFLTDAKMI